MTPESVSNIFIDSTSKGFLQAIKIFWWIIPIALIFFWLNRKIGRRRR